MSEPFDLELFLAGKRLWDEGEPPENPRQPEEWSGTQASWGGGRRWPRLLERDEVVAVRYFVHGGQYYTDDQLTQRDALAAEILRLRDELERRGRAERAMVEHWIPNSP